MLKYIKDLTEGELAKFEKFISSPYFNSNRNIIKLFAYLKENIDHPGNDIPEEKKHIFMSITKSNMMMQNTEN